MGLPDEVEVGGLLEIYITKYLSKLSKEEGCEINVDVVSKKIVGFSGREIEKLCLGSFSLYTLIIKISIHYMCVCFNVIFRMASSSVGISFFNYDQ